MKISNEWIRNLNGISGTERQFQAKRHSTQFQEKRRHSDILIHSINGTTFIYLPSNSTFRFITSLRTMSIQ